MKKTASFLLLLSAALLSTGFMNHNNTTAVKDYLGVPGPVIIGGASYNISWSSHPAANYYKQEYILKGDDVNRFSKMMMLEAVVSESIKPQDALAGKVAELKERKKTDVFVNYQTLANTAKGEYMLDFLLSDGPAAAPNVVEWNVYRYKSFTDKNGHKGLVLFAISMRAYGDKIKPFLASLKDTRTKTINTIAGYEVPPITIAGN
jgi:cobalamin-dependent methionine synthase I